MEVVINGQRYVPVQDKKLKTYVAIILDKSGSMASLRDVTISGFNEQIQSLRSSATDNNEVLVTLVTFNDKVDTVFFNQHVDVLTEIDNKSYQPDGMTAMLDAVGMTIDRLRSETNEGDENNSYLFVIISDGLENASTRYSRHDIAERIQLLKKTGRWTFTYMGANQDLSQVVEDLNIDAGNVTTWVTTMEGAKDAFRLASTATLAYMDMRASGVTSVANFYDGIDQRYESDD